MSLLCLKRGQIQHAFAFIMFIIIAGFITIIGYKGISQLIGGSCDLDKTAFDNKIVNLVDRYDDFGSLHKERIKIPCGYQYICFANNSVYGDASWSLSGTQFHTFNADKMKVLSSANAAKFNVFLVKQFAEPVAYSEKIVISNATGATCIEASAGIVTLEFKGLGQKTLVEKG